ncbi:MAG: hypothetical protein A3A98_01370 [Candidatus Staskawiczbacteria bacterium RIFCSPLOWO2_01_FULL_40_39]|nr:MAG: hypothetical protein A3A98_01370 [Candidatus Staskawiczbacteria bacterium RIFCSPLOWO2_01_FULL_40_39]
MIYWNQKKILLRNIIESIKENGVKSLLDIGAGDVSFAKSIAEHVDSYTAVEKNDDRVRRLQAESLETIKGVFPSIKVTGRYDMVLSSHSIPERIHLIVPFIEKAYRLLKPGGTLLAITFKGGKGDTFKLSKQLDGKRIIHDELLFKELLLQLEKFGKVKIVRKNSTIKSDNLTEILNIILNAIGNKKGKIYKKQIKSILGKQFKKNSKYSFSFEHLFIFLKKKR